MNHPPLLQVTNLSQSFRKGSAKVRAVDDVSFSIAPGETVGLVGESGCGKSTIAKTITRLYAPVQGEILFKNNPIEKLQGNDLIDVRKNIQMIFQDTYASLNPRMTVEEIIQEPLCIHFPEKPKKERSLLVQKLLNQVGLLPEHGPCFPHQISGGQRQRVCIARALILRPELVICDESVAALDVSIQAQIIGLFKDLQQEFGLTYLFISHDLAMAKYLCDRIMVMYLGKIVEMAPSEELYENPLHPYTKRLLKSVLLPDPDRKTSISPSEDESSSLLGAASKGCSFYPRCSKTTPICRRKEPPMEMAFENHYVRCFEHKES